MIVLEKSRVYAVCKLQAGDAPFQNPFLVDDDHDDNHRQAAVAAATKNSTRTARQVNETLNLCLGRPDLFDRQKYTRLIQIIDYVNRFLLIWWEDKVFFPLYNIIPVTWRRGFVYTVWNRLYLPLHQYLLTGRHTAIHRDCSAEYHALTTAFYFGRFLPMTIPRMRFLLHQLTAFSPPPVPQQAASSSFRLERVVNVPVDVPDDTVLMAEKYYADHTTANGLYLHHESQGDSSEYVLLWYYGGAFMSGDAAGQIGPAQWVAEHSCHDDFGDTMDVYIPSIRLAPEVNMYGVLWDVVLAYRYLYFRRQREGRDPTKILLFGCSSGGAIVLRLLQLLQHEDGRPAFLAPLLRGLTTTRPAGAAVVSPYLDFRRHGKDPDGSFDQYARHDLVVNEAVQDLTLPYLDSHMNNLDPDKTEDHSPLAHNLTGLPPLLVIVSEHETVHDETMTLIHQIQKHQQQQSSSANHGKHHDIDITIGYYRYMCHVWLFYHGFLPEGRHAMQLLATWLREQRQPSLVTPQRPPEPPQTPTTHRPKDKKKQ
jgi:epsilon-lactone hydrolase